MLVEPLIPLPASPTVSGLLLALLVTVRVPARAPPAVGVNLTVTVQEAPTAMEAQLLVWLKSPLAATEEAVAAVVPELVTVTVWAGALEPTTVPAKDRLAGAAFSTGPGAVPVPDRLTVLVTPPALMVRVPLRAPGAVGANFTLTVQPPPAAMDDPQVLAWEKSPLVAMDETVAAELVGLATVTAWAALVAPVATEPKLSAVGVAFTPVTG